MFDRSAISTYRNDIVRDLSHLITIPSVHGEAVAGAPFGEAPLAALEFMLERGRALGFATRNVDGYAGHVEYGNRGPLIGILVHLDVVPAGDGWEHDPFGGTVEGDVVYGRGAADNKGPAVTALYVLRAFADQIPDPDARIRIIFGTNEESGMAGVIHYFKHEELPSFGFSPDAGYPLFNREMGIVNVHLSASRSGTRIVSTLTGGEALNMVANEARATILPAFADLARTIVDTRNRDGSMEQRLEIESTDGGVVVTSRGISAHGGRPANGVSAIACLVSAIAETAKEIEAADSQAQVEPEIVALSRLIGFETRGDSLGIACRDGESGELSANWGTIEVNDDSVQTGINIRYPVTRRFDDIWRVLRHRASREGFDTRYEHHLEPLFIPEDDPFIQRLLSAYRSVTGDDTAPLSMSGGTYARMLKNRGVAFGAGFPGDRNNVHQPEEHVSIDALMKHAEISLQAVYELSLPVEGES